MSDQSLARGIHGLLKPMLAGTDATDETLGVQAELVSLPEWRTAAAEPLYAQALTHWQQHDPEAALACLNRQLAMDPSLVSTHLMAAMLLAEQGGHREALSSSWPPCVRTTDRRASSACVRWWASCWALPGPRDLALGNKAAADRRRKGAVARRCYQAPFARHCLLHRTCEGTAALEGFQTEMARTFR